MDALCNGLYPTFIVCHQVDEEVPAAFYILKFDLQNAVCILKFKKLEP